MNPMQYDIERHSPERLANAYRVAADTEERNPFRAPDERVRLAREFRERAERFELSITRTGG